MKSQHRSVRFDIGKPKYWMYLFIKYNNKSVRLAVINGFNNDLLLNLIIANK